MSILIFGGNGLLGKYLIRQFKKNNKVFYPNSHILNIVNIKKIKEFINKNNIEIIINAAGMTNIYVCERNPEKAYKINTYAPIEIAKLSYDYNIKFIHFSSNFVFDGKKESPYIETDKPNPLNIYGKTKYKADIGILENNDKTLIIRSAEIFGVANFNVNHNIPYYIIRQLMNNKRINLYEIKTSPTYAKDLAEKTEELINNNISGIIHITNIGFVSYFDIANRIFQLMNKKTEMRKKNKVFDFHVPRNIQMSSNRLKKLNIAPLSNIDNALQRFIKEVL